MPVKLFVGHVTPGSQKETLEEMFSQYGTVIECSVMNNYAFIHMSTQEEADAAITDLNGFTFNGQQLSVELAKSGMSNKKSGGRIPDRTGLTKIFIGNIKAGTTDDELRSLFETYGDVAEADVCGGFGFVHMKNQGDALKAIKLLKGYLLNGNRLNIELSTNSTQGRSKGGGDDDQYYDDYEYNTGRNDNFRGGRGARGGRGGRGGGRGGGGGGGGMGSQNNMRFDPYKNQSNSRRMPPMDNYSGGGNVGGGHSVYNQNQSLPRTPVNNTRDNSSGDSFARELLDLYLKNPVAFDRYARDPLVQQSLNLTSDENNDAASDPYYRPPREYYEKKSEDMNSGMESMPVTYPNVPMPGYSRGGGVQQQQQQQQQRMPGNPRMAMYPNRMQGAPNLNHPPVSSYMSFE